MGSQNWENEGRNDRPFVWEGLPKSASFLVWVWSPHIPFPMKKIALLLALGLVAGAVNAQTYAPALDVYACDGASATGSSSTACGGFANASGNGATATGAQANGSGQASTATGNYAQATEAGATSTGAEADASGVNSTSTGYRANSSGHSTTATGSQANATGESATATGVAANASGDYSSATGVTANASGYAANATGNNARASADGANTYGSASQASAVNASAFGHGSNASHANAVAIGANTRTTQENEVAMGGRKVTQVANGSISQGSTDAINGGQLWEIMQGMGGSNFDETLWNDRWENINSRFGEVDRRLNGLGAQMGALSMMAATPGEGGVTVGVGFSGGETALAVGWSRRLNDRVSIAVGASFGGGNKAVVGVGLRIGGR